MDETLLFTPKPNTHHQSRRSKTRDFRRRQRGWALRVVSPMPRTNGKVFTDKAYGLAYYGKTSRKAQKEKKEWQYNQ